MNITKKYALPFGTRLVVIVLSLFLFPSINLYSQSCSIVASNDTVIYQSPDTIQLNAVISGTVDSCTIITWAPATGLSNPAILNPTAIVSSSVTYTVTAYIPLDSNLFVNGDFEQGNNFFGTTYNYYCPSYPNYISQNDYCVTDNPNNVHSGAANCSDHTSGTGLMMVVNGDITAPSEVWSQMLTIKQNTWYCFTFWSMNWSYYLNLLPTFDLEMNGVMQGQAFTIDPAACGWKQFRYTWYSGSDTTTTFKIMNLSDTHYGNDFCLDDISLIELCPATDSVIIQVGGTAPLAAFQVSDSFFCEVTCVDFTDQSAGNPTSWQWSFPGGTPSSSTDQNPANICYYSAGTYDVTLMVTNNGGSDTIVQPNFIQVNSAPVVSITQSNDTLYSSFGNSYQWYTGGSAITGATNYFYHPSAADYYSVMITGSNGCTAADTIFFSPAPQTSFSAPDTSICDKFCMDFSDQSTNNPASWQWNFEGGSPSSSTNQNPTNICYNTPGTYDVTLITTNAFGSDTLTLTNYITVHPTPPFPTITQNGNVLTCSPASGYQWQLNSIDIPGATMQSYTYTQTGLYTVFAFDSNGCTNYASILITAVENVSNGSSISVFPNPSNGNFTVELINCSGQTIFLRVLNTLGQELETQSFSCLQNHYKKEINLRNAAGGVYFIEMKIGDEFIRKKIIVVH